MVERARKVVASDLYEQHLTEILQYGILTFGYKQARKYFEMILHFVESLATFYSYHPECRHLATKKRMYRNIILDAHLIIYRITDERIEVLDIIHSASSIRKIREVKKVKI